MCVVVLQTTPYAEEHSRRPVGLSSAQGQGKHQGIFRAVHTHVFTASTLPDPKQREWPAACMHCMSAESGGHYAPP